MIGELIVLVVGAFAFASVMVWGGDRQREIDRLEGLLKIEQGRTGDLLTRLAARSLEQYHAIQVASAPEAEAPQYRYSYDPTGLVVDQELVVSESSD